MAFRIASLSISRRAADLTYRRTFGLGTTRILARSYASALPEEGSTKGGYVSPFQEIFDTIKEGKTSLGTTKKHRVCVVCSCQELNITKTTEDSSIPEQSVFTLTCDSLSLDKR